MFKISFPYYLPSNSADDTLPSRSFVMSDSCFTTYSSLAIRCFQSLLINSVPQQHCSEWLEFVSEIIIIFEDETNTINYSGVSSRWSYPQRRAGNYHWLKVLSFSFGGWLKEWRVVPILVYLAAFVPRENHSHTSVLLVAIFNQWEGADRLDFSHLIVVHYPS